MSHCQLNCRIGTRTSYKINQKYDTESWTNFCHIIPSNSFLGPHSHTSHVPLGGCQIVCLCASVPSFGTQAESLDCAATTCARPRWWADPGAHDGLQWQSFSGGSLPVNREGIYKKAVHQEAAGDGRVLCGWFWVVNAAALCFFYLAFISFVQLHCCFFLYYVAVL